MTKDLAPEEKLTVDTYNNSAAKWGQEHSDPSYWEEEFAKFKSFLPSGKILEIGCGGGRDAKVLILMGYDYVGTDVAKNFIEEAKKNVMGGEFLCQSVYNLGFGDNNFDGFWASAVFLHIPKNKIDDALQEVIRVTKSNGIGFISIKQGEGENIVEEEIVNNKTDKRFWALYNKPEFEEVLKRNNLEILNFKEWIKSKRTIWLIYFVKIRK